MENTQKGSAGIVAIMLIVLIIAGGGVYMYLGQNMMSDTKVIHEDSVKTSTSSAELKTTYDREVNAQVNANGGLSDYATSPDLNRLEGDGNIDTYASKSILPPLTCVNNDCNAAYATVLRPVIPLVTENFFINASEEIYNLGIDENTVKKLISYMVSLREEVSHPGDGSVRNDVDHFDPALAVQMALMTIDDVNPNFNIAQNLVNVYNTTTSELGKKRILWVLEKTSSDLSADVMLSLLKSTTDQYLFRSALRNIIYLVENKKDSKYGTTYITSELFSILDEEWKNTPSFKSTYIMQVLSKKTDIVNMVPNSYELTTIASGKAGNLSINSRLLAIYFLALNHMDKVGVKNVFLKLESDPNTKIAAYAKDVIEKPVYPSLYME